MRPEGSNSMDVKEAVSTARHFIKTLYVDEPIAEVGVEEIDFDAIEQVWTITIGFRRLWDRPQAFEALSGRDHRSHRVYKDVNIRDNDRKVISMKGRTIAEPS